MVHTCKEDVHTIKIIEQLFKTLGCDLWCLKLMLKVDSKIVEPDLPSYNILLIWWYGGLLNPLINDKFLHCFW